MPWFITREEADQYLARITRNPNYSYTVVPHGCAPGWAVEVRDADGVLITEAYDGEVELAATMAERNEEIKEIEREIERSGKKPR